MICSDLRHYRILRKKKNNHQDGSIATISHGSFGKIWKSFLDANKRCRPESETVEPFSIEEVVEILKTNAITEEDILRARLAVQESVSSRLRFNLNQIFGRYIVLNEDEFRGRYKDIRFAIIEDHNSKGRNYQTFKNVIEN